MSPVCRRQLRAVSLVTLALVGGALPALASSPAASSARGPVRVSVVDSSQRAILRSGAVRVRLRAVRQVIVRIHVRGRSGRSPIHTVARDAVIRVGPGTRTVKLRLTRAGKRILAPCGDLGLHVTGTGRRFGANATRTVTADLPRCRD